MSRHTVVFNNEQIKTFVTNSKRGADYKATIQNLSGQILTISVTNDDIQGVSPGFSAPSNGPLVINNGLSDVLNEPYDGWELSAGAVTTGTVLITESG